MKRRWLILLIPAILVVIGLSAMFVSADDSNIKPSDTTISANKSINFKIDLSGVTEDEYGEYNLTVWVTPTSPKCDLTLKENIGMVVNQNLGTYRINYDDLVDKDTLHFVLKPDKSIEKRTTYTVKYVINGEIDGQTKTREESFKLVVKPETKKETVGGDYSGGSAISDEGDIDDGEDDSDDDTTYKGSYDNYLKSLKVSGYEFEQNFHKTRDIYFVNVPKSVKSLAVSAVACDKSAKVAIAGNEDVSRNMSKIIVNVTAANGDERVYRIYVTHDTEDKQ